MNPTMGHDGGKLKVALQLEASADGLDHNMGKTTPSRASPTLEPVYDLKDSSVSILPVFRDERWQHVPSNLLCKGSGCPCCWVKVPSRVRCIDDQTDEYDHFEIIPWPATSETKDSNSSGNNHSEKTKFGASSANKLDMSGNSQSANTSFCSDRWDTRDVSSWNPL